MRERGWAGGRCGDAEVCTGVEGEEPGAGCMGGGSPRAVMDELDGLHSGSCTLSAGRDSCNGHVPSLASVNRSAKEAIYASLSRKRIPEVQAFEAWLKFASVNRSIFGCSSGG